MTDELLVEILQTGLRLELKAVDAYSRLQTITSDPELKSFWHSMMKDEAEHVSYWKRLVELAQEGALPQVFDSPGRVMNDLTSLEPKIDELFRSVESLPTVSKMFLLAYRMEFYMLHPAISLLFKFAQLSRGEFTAEEDYHGHLNKFLTMLRKYATDIPELELLSDTIDRLWQDNVRLLQHSTTDLLTDVLNRRGLMQVMTMLASLARRNGLNTAIMMMDIDNFKTINDSYGHQIGDEVLVKVAQLVSDSTRASDVVGRYGGDELLVFLTSVKRDALPVLAETIRNRVQRETRFPFPVTVTIGIAEGTITGDVDDELRRFIREADECLYDAKRDGKNRVEICPVPTR